jgi:hypothetical protein
LWTYAVVAVAVVLAALWLLAAVIHFVVGLVKVAIVVVLALALMAWVVGKKSER